MSRIGIEFLSVFGLPPVDYVNLVADMGVYNISTAVYGSWINPNGYPPFSLATDKALRREVGAALRDRGVSISLGEGFRVTPETDVSALAPSIEAMQELGAKRINTISMDPDLSRTFDQFAIVAEMAAAAGMETTTEFVPGLTVADLPTALAALRHVGRPDFRLNIDAMHLIRSGSSPADLAALDPHLIGYCQLCDVPLVPTIPDYLEEAMTERGGPGDGELPLSDILAAIPPHIVVSLEIPQLAKAKSGVGHRDRLLPAVEATRALLSRLPVTTAA